MPAAWSTSATSTTRWCRVARTASSRPMPWRARVSAERDGTMHIAIYVAAAIAAAGAGCAFAQGGDALQRPALSVKAPQRAVLLAAAAAGQRLVAVGERGVVALSDDRGVTWQQAACPVSVSLTMVRFADERHGVAVGHGGTVLTTSDAGASWALRLDGRRLAALAKAAATTPQALQDAERLMADGPDQPFSDGGITFEALPSPYKGSWFAGDLNANGRVVLAGMRGNAWRSDDVGNTWSQLASPTQSAITAVADDGNGGLWFATQAGAVLRQQGEALVPLNAAPVPVPSALLPQREGPLLALGVAGVVPVVAQKARP